MHSGRQSDDNGKQPTIQSGVMDPHVREALGPLTDTYRLAGRPAPRVDFLPGQNMPGPYRDLLVHDRDMTPTLEAFHGEVTELELIQRLRIGDTLLRQVVIVARESKKRVEFGAIRIFLNAFDEEPRRRILECRWPLGSILAHFAIPHMGKPAAFFRVASDASIEHALDLPRPMPLYGRCNTICDPNERSLACIVEILSPVDDKESQDS